MRAVSLAALLALLLAFAPSALAQDKPTTPPADASVVTAGNFTATYWVLPASALDANANGTLHVQLAGANGTAIGAFDAIANSTTLHFHEQPIARNISDPNATSTSFSIPFTVDAAAADGNATYAFTIHAGNGTNKTTLAGTGAVAVHAIRAPAPGLPAPYLWGGAALLLVVAGVVAYQVRDRRLRARMRGESRSRALREQELERIAEKRPEQAVAIQQEIRREEKVREKRREVQILEAKRADVEKQLDMLRKRHDAGQLSKLQFDNMAKKRHDELVKIDEEIVTFEREG